MTDPRDAIRETFDERAANYDDSAMHGALAEAVADFAVSGGTEGISDVLDVATGTGLVLRALAVRHPPAGFTLVGSDLSPGMLAVARAALPTAVFVEADAVALPVDDDSIDLVTCVTALHLIPDTAGVFGEWRRVLRPGGGAVVATFAAGEDGVAPHGHGHPTTARRYPVDHVPFASAEAMARTAGEHGFEVERHEIWQFEDDRMLLTELRPA